MPKACYLISVKPVLEVAGTKQISRKGSNPAAGKGAHTVDVPEKSDSTEKSVDNHDGLKGWQLLRQVLIGVTVAMISVSSSANSAAAVMLPELMMNGSDITLTTLQGTWFASVHSLAAAGGSTLGGLTVHHLGPRRVLLLQAVPTIAGWLMMALANGYPMLLVGRCLVGACTGLSMSAAQVYVGESSSPQIRGRIVCIIGVFNGLGGLLSYIVGYVMPWRWVPAAPVILFLVPSALAMLLVPESPYWLLGKQKSEEARRSLMTLRGDVDVVEKDLAIMTEACKSRQKALTPLELVREMRKLPVLAPFLTVTALFIIRILTGISAVLTYTVAIFQETGSAVDAHQSSILLGVVGTVTSAFCALYVSDRFGRRPLLVSSGVCCMLTTLAMAAFLFGRDQAPDWAGWQYISWLPLPLILLYNVCYEYGLSRTGWTVHAEIFPNRMRSALSGFGVLIHFVGIFIAVLAFPFIREAFTLAGAFCSFAFFSLVCILLTVFFIPETRNKRLETIEDFYLQRFASHKKPIEP